MDSNHENNPFDKLPDALMLFILNKILETKTLVSCFLVSKRFASLLPQTKTNTVLMNRRSKSFGFQGQSVIRDAFCDDQFVSLFRLLSTLQFACDKTQKKL
uniref:F-box domain-containing protein n=1 Tax=Quercus lobata TaxID=97700 RepID=A0A7N2LTE6_QUELO